MGIVYCYSDVTCGLLLTAMHSFIHSNQSSSLNVATRDADAASGMSDTRSSGRLLRACRYQSYFSLKNYFLVWLLFSLQVIVLVFLQFLFLKIKSLGFLLSSDY